MAFQYRPTGTAIGKVNAVGRWKTWRMSFPAFSFMQFSERVEMADEWAAARAR